jgi:hypothetical protein
LQRSHWSLQIILAIYYTLADIVLLCQCFYYEGFTLSWNPKSKDAERNHERSPLLDRPDDRSGSDTLADGETHGHPANLRDRLLAVDATHLSPVTPLLQDDGPAQRRPPPPPPPSAARTLLFNSLVIVLVCSAGAVGWLLGNSGPRMEEPPGSPPERRIAFSPLGQLFGYVCAALYLGSRVPQLLLNCRRRSTEGISMLFFVFACIGNLTYVLSIVAYGPVCERPERCREGEAAGQYKRYMAVNLSWILGSLGTLVLDLGVFVQYFLYKGEQSEDSDRDEVDEGGFVTEPAVVSRNASQRREVIYETEGWT